MRFPQYLAERKHADVRMLSDHRLVLSDHRLVLSDRRRVLSDHRLVLSDRRRVLSKYRLAVGQRSITFGNRDGLPGDHRFELLHIIG
ncbi:MAG: hypothetical protein ACI8P0_002529, partial [Planctomycetaceae bacterium]